MRPRSIPSIMGPMIESGRRVGDLLQKLGLPAEAMNARLGDVLRKSGGSIERLRLGFGRAAEPNKFTHGFVDARVEIPPAGYVPPPSTFRARKGAEFEKTYGSAPRSIAAKSSTSFLALLDPKRMQAAKLTRLVQINARVRETFEKVAGGQVLLDGRCDGKLSMVESGGTNVKTSAMSAPPGKETIYKLFMYLDAEVLKQAQAMRPGLGQSPDLDMGYGSAASAGSTSSRYRSDDEDEEDAEDRGQVLGLSSRPLYPSVDTLDLLHAKEANTTSVDEATLRLKRLSDKREHMYDVYRQAMDKYNQSARAAVDNLKA